MAEPLSVVSEDLAKGTRKPDTVSGKDIYAILQDGLYLLLDAPDNVRSILGRSTLATSAPSIADGYACPDEYEPHVKPIFSQWLGYIRKQRKTPSSFPSTVIDDFRNAAKETWPSILTQLRDASRGSDKIVINFMRSMSSVWFELGEELGLQEESMDDTCSWRECEWHRKPSAEPLRDCSACNTVRYCSRECQLKYARSMLTL